MKDNIVISKITRERAEKLSEQIREEILIISKASQDLLQIDNAIVYEEIVQNFCAYAMKLYYHDCNYNYFYLKTSLRKAVEDETETIVVGSSYAWHGVEPQMLEKCVNLGLSSQDIYYSDKIIRSICDNHKKMKNVIWGCGYYTVYLDLSKCQNRVELQKISDVYEPIFEDAHNCILLPAGSYSLDKSRIFDVEKIVEDMASLLYRQNGSVYWVEGIKNREHFQYRWAYDEPGKNWKELSEYEKESAGQRRAAIHNHNLKRKRSLEENTNILNELSIFCDKRNINFIVTVFPATKYYTKYLDLQYKEDFYHVLERLSGKVHVVDCWDAGIFEDGDFIDTDHLNEKGAVKMTNILKEILEELKAPQGKEL